MQLKPAKFLSGEFVSNPILAYLVLAKSLGAGMHLDRGRIPGASSSIQSNPMLGLLRILQQISK